MSMSVLHGVPYRDSFQNVVELLDDMFQRAAAADEPPESNFIRKHCDGLRSGSGDAVGNAAARLFSNPAGDYGSMVNERVGASNWNSSQVCAQTPPEHMHVRHACLPTWTLAPAACMPHHSLTALKFGKGVCVESPVTVGYTEISKHDQFSRHSSARFRTQDLGVECTCAVRVGVVACRNWGTRGRPGTHSATAAAQSGARRDLTCCGSCSRRRTASCSRWTRLSTASPTSRCDTATLPPPPPTPL